MGYDFVDHLTGMFANAIADTERNEVLLVRDRLGIKPLYVARPKAARLRTRQHLAQSRDVRNAQAYCEHLVNFAHDSSGQPSSSGHVLIFLI